MMASLIRTGEGTTQGGVHSGLDPVFRASAGDCRPSHADLDEDGEDQPERQHFRPFTVLFTAFAAILGIVLLVVNMLRVLR